MSTIQDIVNLARLDLNDTSTSTSLYRYPDSDLVQFVNDGLALAYVLRPDLKFGNYTQVYADLALTDSFPLPSEYRPAIASYVVARNQSGDDSFVLNQRAEMEMAMYLKELGAT